MMIMTNIILDVAFTADEVNNSVNMGRQLVRIVY